MEPAVARRRPRRHSSEEVTDNGTASNCSPCPGCGLTMRPQQMTNKKETFFGCIRFPLCNTVVHVPLTAESHASPSVSSCSAAQTSEAPVMMVDSDPAASQPEQQFLLQQLQLLSSSGIAGQEALRAILQMFPDPQQKITVNMQSRSCRPRCRVAKQHGSDAEVPRVKPEAGVNAALWELAVLHFENVSDNTELLQSARL